MLSVVGWVVRLAVVGVVLGGMGCRVVNEGYCDNTRPCRSPERPFCDTLGQYPASEGVNNICIPDPYAASDAGIENGLMVSPSTGDFSAQHVSLVGSGQVFTITNATSLPSGEITIDITDSSAFAIANNGCVSTLQPGKSCTFEVRTLPTVVGTFSGTVNVSSAIGSQQVSLTGAGTSAALADLQLESAYSELPLEPQFSSDVYSYQSVASYATQAVKVTPVAQDPDASIEVNGMAVTSGGTSGLITVGGEANAITVSVTTQSGQSQSYSLTIDATKSIAQRYYIKSDEPLAGAFFGYDVAVDGHVLVVGAPNASNGGAVFVFEWKGTAWRQTAVLRAEKGDPEDRFGISVDVDGDVIVIGATGDDAAFGAILDDNSLSDSGAVYVFRRSDTNEWLQEARLKASNADVEDYFGASVAIDGDMIVVGAPGEDSARNAKLEDNSAAESGGVYVFHLHDGSWQQLALHKPPLEDESYKFFGSNVDISNNTIVAGIPRYSFKRDYDLYYTSRLSSSEGGAVAVFERVGDIWKTNVLEPSLVLHATEPLNGVLFGSSVAISNDIIVVGAQGANSLKDYREGLTVSMYKGLAFVFERSSDGSWEEQTVLAASNADNSDNYGTAVAINGDVAVVTATGESSGLDKPDTDNSLNSSGAAYIFVRDASGNWVPKGLLKASNAGEDDGLGQSVAISRGMVVLGTGYEDSEAIGVKPSAATDNDSENSGAVYVWY